MLMVSISYQCADTGSPTGGSDVRQQRAVPHRYHGLGELERERAEPRPEAGCQDERARHRPQYA